MDEEQKALFDVHMAEYQTLKTEQFQRIRLRDNVVYLAIVATALIISLVQKLDIGIPLLIYPWASLILGWTYLMTDEKVSAIGRYIRYDLSSSISKVINSGSEELFGWETAHRSDSKRIERKYFQLLIDELVFIVPALMAIAIYLVHFHNEEYWFSSLRFIICLTEIVLVSYLGYKIYQYADLKSGK